MEKGDLVIAALPGDYGKPRPALVIQSNLLSELPSTVVCPLTSHIREDIRILRVVIDPTISNGLRERSHIIVDKVTAIPTTKISQKIGKADAQTLLQVKTALTVLFDL